MLTKSERENLMKELTPSEAEQLLYDWYFWARENQKTPEGAWVTWLIDAGRGFGKTRTGAEQIKKWKEEGYRRFALVAQTPAEARDVLVEGESGILTISPPWDMPIYEPSKRRLTWKNGAIATVYSGENPEVLRGPQHEKAWVDELAKYKYPQDVWDNLMFGLRLGDNPQVIVTTTPRPIKTIKQIISDPSTIHTRGSTFDNYGNLAKSFIDTVIRKYEGTRLGRQELYAEMLDDNPNALWNRAMFDNNRISKPPEMKRIVVSLDPAATSTEGSDEFGILVQGIDENNKGYVIEDSTMKGSPKEWGTQAITLYHKYQADIIIGERNNGGEMIEYTIKSIDPTVNYKSVWASKGKYTRAEPIAALYEQNKIKHIGNFAALEDECCEWVPGEKSPNRLDAMVWGFTELMLTDGQEFFVC